MYVKSSEPRIKASSLENFNGIYGHSLVMKQLYRLITRIAPTNSTVLINGETGSGKELTAKAIHKLSKRSGELVSINCGALSPEILESELFGHEVGAFTGAINQHRGCFERANNGSLFLDEVSELSPILQVKLLRVLQEQEFCRLGSSTVKNINTRIIAACNKDLKLEVKAGRFREDLFYRLQVLPIVVPSLREREDDILLLVDHFKSNILRENNLEDIEFTKEALESLRSYSWPGNVRELKNVVERLCVLSSSNMIDADKLHFIQTTEIEIAESVDTSKDIVSFEAMSVSSLMGEIEDQLISWALEKAAGNQKHAASILGINRTTLIQKIKRRSIEQGQYSESLIRNIDDIIGSLQDS